MLPKTNHRVITEKLPLSDVEVRFRPMKGSEEKLLLLAKESEDTDEILSTVKMIVNNCLLEGPDVEKMPIFHVEWLFIRIRIESISPVTSVSYLDPSDEKRYDFEVDLREVVVDNPGGEDVIKLEGDISIRMRWPTSNDFIDPRVMIARTEAETAHQMAISCVDVIYEGDQAHKASDYPREEVDMFLSSLDSKDYKSVLDWLSLVPALKYTIKWTNSKGEDREVTLSTLTDFFRFR